MWPAHYQTLDPREGTCYVGPALFLRALETHRPAGQAWRYNQCWSTYLPKRTLAIKSLRNLDVRDEGQFWDVMREAESAGVKTPPTSCGDLFSSVFRSPIPRRSVIRPFRGMSFGGWEQAFQRGEINGHIYQYDLNSAYRWAACAGLPNLRNCYPTRDYTLAHAIYLVDLAQDSLPYNRSAGLAAITSEEREMFDVVPRRVLGGVAFRSTINLSDAFAQCDQKFPSVRKRINHAFWGSWNTMQGPEQVGFKSGSVRHMRNPFYNPVWSAYITSRVKMRLSVWAPRAVMVYVDAVWTRDQLPLSTESGGWKLAGEYDNLWIRHAGCWGTGDHVIKRAGMPRGYEKL